MREKFTFEIQKEGNWFVGFCPEVPGANGHGRTLMACSRNLIQAIAMILDDEDAPQAIEKTIEVDAQGTLLTYRVSLFESWEGFAVSCPDLPGCFSQGDDEEEALENVRSAIKDYVEVAEEMRQEKNQRLEKVA